MINTRTTVTKKSIVMRQRRGPKEEADSSTYKTQANETNDKISTDDPCNDDDDDATVVMLLKIILLRMLITLS